MKLVRADPRAARHLGGHLYEVRARRSGRAYRVLFVTEGRRQQVLVAVDAFHKTTTRTPPARLRVARERAREWRSRGAELGLERGRAR
jgi:phage-related protein